MAQDMRKMSRVLGEFFPVSPRRWLFDSSMLVYRTCDIADMSVLQGASLFSLEEVPKPWLGLHFLMMC